jgi:diguanylate cyclase (GGDEF)-like protein/PAS domain S-box-containing protein
MLEKHGTVRYVNPAVERALGYRPGDLAEAAVFDYIHPQDKERVVREFEESLGAPENCPTLECRVRAADGSWRRVEVMRENSKNSTNGPRIQGGVPNIRDVTERVRVEEMVRFQARLLDAVGQAVVATDPEGEVLYWNRCAEALYGWSAEEAVGQQIDELMLSGEARERAAEIMEEIRAGKSWSGEFEVRRRDGTSFPAMVTDTPVYDEQGEMVGIIGVSTDITERKKVEEALRESERRFSSVVSYAHAFAYRCLKEPGYRNEYASDYALELTGYSPEDLLVGGEIRFGDLIIGDDRDRIWEEVQEALEERKSFELRYAIRRKDGQIRHVRDHGQGVYDENGEVVALEGLLYDVTETVEAEQRLQEAEERYRTLVERIPAIVYIQEPGEPSRTTYVSPQNEIVLGYSLEESLAGPGHWIRIMHPEDRERVLAEDKRTNGTAEPFVIEYRQFAKDGRLVWIRDEATPVRDEAGKLLYWLGVQTDITERKQAEEALRESEQRLRASFEDAGIGMALVATDGRWMEVNRSLCEILGYAEEELLEKTFQEITHPDDLHNDLEKLRRLLAGEIRTYKGEKRYLHKEGHVVWVLLSVSPVHDKDGEPLYFVSQIQDISERKRMEERLQHWALHDPLTGLPNRRLFMDRLRQALGRTRRRRGRNVAVLFMDLDGFKIMNDSLGHDSGDLLLTVVAQRLERCLRPEDTLGRFGGDEFVLLLEDVELPDEAVRVAEKIANELRRPFAVDGRSLSITASVGIAIGDARTSSPENLLRDADTAMYWAKESGTGYTVFDPTMYLRAVERLELENDLRRAVEREEFVVHYQPVLNLDSGEVWGVEALVRWNHPERGLLEPDEFVPVAEECGLVVQIGEQVLEDACRKVGEWREEHPHTPPLVVSVNVSAKQLARPNFAETVEGVLGRTGLEGSYLDLEVTETAYVEALDGRKAALDRIRAMGVRITIDDFGTGFSSLSYLKRLSADALKIDKSFVAGLGEYTEDTAIGRMVIELAHTLGLKVVAEGVERWSQAALLAEMGCDFAQGYHFARPLPPEEVPGFLEG